ncbi:MAG: hypothetical protein KDK34_12990, partial [Leptospiraceae bacterium]|nr:hypothetical protein [Leptospiraceae bacterium]
LLETILDCFNREGRDIKSIPKTLNNDYDFQGARILLVEDNDINLQVATEILESYNLNITSARNGSEAVEQFEAGKGGY